MRGCAAKEHGQEERHRWWFLMTQYLLEAVWASLEGRQEGGS